MTTASDDAASGELNQSGANELTIFAFGAGCVTVELIHDLHSKSDQVWFDLPILLVAPRVFGSSYR